MALKYNGRPVNYVNYNGRPVVLEAPKPRPFIVDDYDHYDETHGRPFVSDTVKQSTASKNSLKNFLKSETAVVENFRRGYGDMQTNLNRYGPDKYPILSTIGRGLVSTTNGLVNVVAPSAVTRTDGPKLTRMSGRSKTTKTRKKRRVTRKPRQTRWTRNLGTKNMGRITVPMMKAIKQDVRDLRAGARPRRRTIQAPVALGGVYGGSRTSIVPMLRRYKGSNMNCSSIKTRVFIGQVIQKAVTGATSLAPSATELGGQWFFAPTNVAYFPTGSNVLTLARMYQYYFLRGCSFELDSAIQPGQTTPLRIYSAFIDDPNLGETFIPLYTSSTTVSPTNILKLPMSKSEPAWKPTHVFTPPYRWYAGKKFTARNYALVETIVTDTNDTVAQNKQSIPFALWLTVSGPIPLADLIIGDLFINVHIDFCDLAPTQIFDTVGSPVLQASLAREHKRQLERKKAVKVLRDSVPSPTDEYQQVDDIEEVPKLAPKTPLKSSSHK